jgi:hypothetical protein
MRAAKSLMIGLMALTATSACTDTDSTTNLNPIGPPMLRQVRMNHRIFDANGNSSTRRVFGFGAHELASVDELKSGQVTDGIVVNNNFRLVIDELLVGNNLEEIACRSPVADLDGDGTGDTAFSSVPIGATPDDIARCAVADDVLPSACGGPTAVCLCQIPLDEVSGTGGCTPLAPKVCSDTEPCATGQACVFGSCIIKENSPVGVLDVNQDGGVDDTRFKLGALQFNCTAADGQPVEVPVNLDTTYWNPSGTQDKPAMGGFEALGPAIVLAGGGIDSTGRDHGATLPTNTSCTLSFAENVVDKQGLQLCAPPNGDIGLSCDAGDLSEFAWKTEILEYIPITFTNAATGVSRAGPIVLATTAPLLPATVLPANITITENGNPFTAFAPDFKANMATVIPLTLDTCSVTTTKFCSVTADCPATEVCSSASAATKKTLAANATYVITMTTSITDSYDQPPPAAKVFTFTTGAN